MTKPTTRGPTATQRNSTEERNLPPSCGEKIPTLDWPTVEEIFNKPYPPAGPIPPAWTGDSIAVELADRECARLIANQLFDPPIHEAEIDKYARRFNVSRREAEAEIRRQRHAS
jgi:alkanesulfonate monooxygenase SsuD/methylene tetrahydromethanopterin reductase-like flavin-dependent oxidoreductase (luciferase family)